MRLLPGSQIGVQRSWHYAGHYENGSGLLPQQQRNGRVFECHGPMIAGGLAHEQCRDGHTGVLCAVCAENFVRVNGVCRTAIHEMRLRFTGVSDCYSVAAVLLCVFTQKTAADESKNDDAAKEWVEGENTSKIDDKVADPQGIMLAMLEHMGAPESFSPVCAFSSAIHKSARP